MNKRISLANHTAFLLVLFTTCDITTPVPDEPEAPAPTGRCFFGSFIETMGCIDDYTHRQCLDIQITATWQEGEECAADYTVLCENHPVYVHEDEADECSFFDDFDYK